MSMQLSVDVKELYKQLCPECKKKMVKLAKFQPSEEAIIKALESD